MKVRVMGVRAFAYLDSVLEAVELSKQNVSCAPFADSVGDKGDERHHHRLLLTSQHELAIWQPAWPTKSTKVSIHGQLR